MRPVAGLALALALAGQAAQGGPVEVTAGRTLRPGTVVEAGDLRVPEGAETLARELVGREVRRAVYAGRPVRPDDVGPVTLVGRNTVVTMRYRSGALSIRTEGRALDAGGAGERIRVINLDTRQPVAAVVRAPGLVEVMR